MEFKSGGTAVVQVYGVVAAYEGGSCDAVNDGEVRFQVPLRVDGMDGHVGTDLLADLPHGMCVLRRQRREGESPERDAKGDDNRHVPRAPRVPGKISADDVIELAHKGFCRVGEPVVYLACPTSEEACRTDDQH